MLYSAAYLRSWNFFFFLTKKIKNICNDNKKSIAEFSAMLFL